MESRCQKQEVSEVMFCLKMLGKVPPFSLQVVVSRPWRFWPTVLSLLLCLCCYIVLLPLCPNFFITKVLVIRLCPTLITYDLILTWLLLQRSDFQIKSHSQVLGFGTRIYFWRVGEQIQLKPKNRLK